MIKVATSNKDFKRGDIFMINPNPVKGHEQSGYRPVVVLSNNLQKYSPHMLQIAPITTKDKGYPLHVKLETEFNMVSGVILTDHNRTIDVMEYKSDFKIIDIAHEVCIIKCKKIINDF